MAAQGLMHQLVGDPDNPRSLAARARQRRWDELLRRMPDLARLRVLDLGGVAATWQRAPVRPASVALLNIEPVPAEEPWIESWQGDACSPPAALLGRDFDLVYSNSLVEHLGGHARRQEFAAAVHRLADRHWIQTPYRYFPLEPHWLLPGFQFLPVNARIVLTQRLPVGHVRAADRRAALDEVSWIELVGLTEMRGYFPHSDLWREQSFGLTKSLVAVR
jgi:hypothetical protein